jgi:hypothetical protein
MTGVLREDYGKHSPTFLEAITSILTNMLKVGTLTVNAEIHRSKNLKWHLLKCSFKVTKLPLQQNAALSSSQSVG